MPYCFYHYCCTKKEDLSYLPPIAIMFGSSFRNMDLVTDTVIPLSLIRSLKCWATWELAIVDVKELA